MPSLKNDRLKYQSKFDIDFIIMFTASFLFINYYALHEFLYTCKKMLGHARTHTCKHAHTHDTRMHVHTHVHTDTYTLMLKHAHTHACTHARTHTHARACTSHCSAPPFHLSFSFRGCIQFNKPTKMYIRMLSVPTVN